MIVAPDGVVRERRKRRRVPSYKQPFASASVPNRAWCTDFKGWFRTRDGERIVFGLPVPLVCRMLREHGGL